jgi:hypothetical protein
MKIKKIIISLCFCIMLCGCTEAEKVSYNVSKQADNFNVKRRLTVINTRTDKCILQMTGKISIEDVTGGIAVLVEVDRDKGIYQKHWVYLNENTMYTVEDLNGVEVSKYAYEMEYMPQTLVPIRIRADEILQDYQQHTESEDEGGDDNN